MKPITLDFRAGSTPVLYRNLLLASGVGQGSASFGHAAIIDKRRP